MALLVLKGNLTKNNTFSTLKSLVVGHTKRNTTGTHEEKFPNATGTAYYPPLILII
jgi:hypothetical protein